MLSIKNLTISFANTKIVNDISFNLKPKKITALIGRSGSGKSVTALSIVGLLRKAKIEGEIVLHNRNMLKLSEAQMCKIRGKEIGFIFQDPNVALNPLHKVGKQISEAVTIHNPKISQEKLAEKVGISTAYMGFIEQGRYIPSMQVLQKLSRILKIKVSELIPFWGFYFKYPFFS